MLKSISTKICMAGAGFILAAGMAGALMAQPALAEDIPAYNGASISSNIATGTVCKKFDLNNDGVKDSVSYTLKASKDDPDAYRKLTLKVNNAKKICIKASHFYTPTVNVFKFDNDKCLIYVYMPDDNDYSTTCLYKYNGKKITRAWKNTKNLFGNKYGTHMNGSIIKLTGNKFIATYDVQPYACGMTTFKYSFRYTTNKVVRTSAAAKAKANFQKGQKSIKWSPITADAELYTGLSLTNWSTLKKGTKAKVIGVYIEGDKKLIKVFTKTGKTGYIKVTNYKKSTANTLFKYAAFAG